MTGRIATRLKTAGWVARSVVTDLRYGGVLAGTVRSRHRQQAGAYNVVNSPYSVLPQIFAGRIRPDDVLVDIGCGKGRVINWWLSRGLRNRIYGIEIDPEIAAATRRRLAKRGHRNVTIITGDATTAVPNDATLLYLYNPFDAAATERFKSHLTDRFAGRGVTALYWNPHWFSVFAEDPQWSSELIPLTEVGDPRIAAAHQEYAVLRLKPGRARRGRDSACVRRSTRPCVNP